MLSRISILFILLNLLVETGFSQRTVIIDHRHANLSQIPDNWIDSAQKKLKVRYYRRSHGSQIDEGGMTALMNYSTQYASKYKFYYQPTAGSLHLTTQFISADYDTDSIYRIARQYLDNPANAATNVLSFAWSYNFTETNIQAYLDTLENFIRDYGQNGRYIQNGKRTVPVNIVFQTACSHKDPTKNQTIYTGNKLIRQHCINNQRILYDFADIEAHNPDGVYFGDMNPDGSYSGSKLLHEDISYNINTTTRGNWGIEWMNAHPTNELSLLAADNICTSCAHSNGSGEDNSRLHCVLKGIAAWWMFAALAGWEEGITYTDNPNLAEAFNLKNYPNPFTGITYIQYQLIKNATVRLSVYDSEGRMIKMLYDGYQPAGEHILPFTINGNKGIYFYTLEVNGQRSARKMIKL